MLELGTASRSDYLYFALFNNSFYNACYLYKIFHKKMYGMTEASLSFDQIVADVGAGLIGSKYQHFFSPLFFFKL